MRFTDSWLIGGFRLDEWPSCGAGNGLYTIDLSYRFLDVVHVQRGKTHDAVGVDDEGLSM